MKRRTTHLSNVAGVWTLPVQPFARRLILATIGTYTPGAASGGVTPTLKILDSTGAVKMQVTVGSFGFGLSAVVSWSDAFWNTNLGILNSEYLAGIPCLWIEANDRLIVTAAGWIATDTISALVLVTEDEYPGDWPE